MLYATPELNGGAILSKYTPSVPLYKPTYSGALPFGVMLNVTVPEMVFGPAPDELLISTPAEVAEFALVPLLFVADIAKKYVVPFTRPGRM